MDRKTLQKMSKEHLIDKLLRMDRRLDNVKKDLNSHLQSNSDLGRIVSLDRKALQKMHEDYREADEVNQILFKRNLKMQDEISALKRLLEDNHVSF